jgi:hypothetical protein
MVAIGPTGERKDEKLAERQIRAYAHPGVLGITRIQRNCRAMEPRISAVEFLAMSTVFWLEPGLAQSGIDGFILGCGGRGVRAGGQTPLFPEREPSPSFTTPLRLLDILRQRYARGEITREEFLALRKDMQS